MLKMLKVIGLSVLLVTSLRAPSCSGAKRRKQWAGKLVFQDDFDGVKPGKENWSVIDNCSGLGLTSETLECYSYTSENVQVVNSSLILRARPSHLTINKLIPEVRNYTSGKVVGIGHPFSYGTFIVRAKLAMGVHLFPTISLMPAFQDHDRCKYEEISVVTGKGSKSSAMFTAKFGQDWKNVFVHKFERVFRNKDFHKDFHEFAVMWKPTRIEWFVDDELVHSASTFYVRDWLLPDESNLPCSSDLQPFRQKMHLSMSLKVGGDEGEDERYGQLTPQMAEGWLLPQMEIDWVRIYQYEHI